MINKAAFEHFISVKETHSKLNDIEYKEFWIQPYLTSQKLSNQEKQLLYKLGSTCNESKMNFKKINRNNLQCVFGCLSSEDQEYSFIHCSQLVSKINTNYVGQYTYIFGTIEEQICTMRTYQSIQKLRNHVLKSLHLPGGVFY